MVGMQSATDLAALGPGTLLIDYSCYVFTFLAVAGRLSCHTMCLLRTDGQKMLAVPGLAMHCVYIWQGCRSLLLQLVHSCSSLLPVSAQRMSITEHGVCNRAELPHPPTPCSSMAMHDCVHTSHPDQFCLAPTARP